MTDETKAKLSAAMKGRTKSPETREKLSVAMKGRVKSSETRAKISASHKGMPSSFLGHHHSDEAKAKNAAAHIGLKVSIEVREKMSFALMGNTYNLGHKASLDARVKQSAAQTGRPHPHKGGSCSEVARARVSVALMGHAFSPESRAKSSVSHWRGGVQTSNRRSVAKRRSYGFVPLNSPFIGCEGHHINTQDVIYMPKELHRSIFHRQSDGRGMAQVNALAGQYLTEDWT